ncbi:cholesterol 24-hydroxylase-like [Paramuricea clavata]|uniref:Cholesterol 24-hydroxylase-like n=1 Tax=Paramuricea clavata TaxID=317549 RepID=A0A6S7JW58_PARCT|nr:cholesterol 24-hydroxylase-like [Paramuricea clavata]
MNPAFHRKYLKDFMTNFNNVSDRLLNRMGEVADGAKPVSMVKEFAKATLDTISKVGFDMNTTTIEDPDSPFPSAIRHYLDGVLANFQIPISSQLLGIFQFKLFQTDSQRVQINAARFLQKFASDCITTRMKDIAENKDVPNDLLNLLINDGSLTKEEIVDEFLTIFISSQETTANALAFTLYEILRNPHVEAKLLNEIKDVLAPTREVLQEITVGGYRIPKGTGVASRSMFFSRNPEIWKDPEVFDPERFADAGNIPNLSMIHFPFSIGLHNCIGQTFSKFESKVFLARLFQKFQFKLLPNQTDQMVGWMNLMPRDGVMCKVYRRTGRYDGE